MKLNQTYSIDLQMQTKGSYAGAGKGRENGKGDLEQHDAFKQNQTDPIEVFIRKRKYMEKTIQQERENLPTYVWQDNQDTGEGGKKKQQRQQGKMEQRIRTDNNLKTKENTMLIVDLNNLKFENKKQ